MKEDIEDTTRHALKVTRAKKIVNPMMVVIITKRHLLEARRRPGPFYSLY